MKYITKKVCPKGCNKGFSTTAHVMQQWKVDERGNYKDVLQDCLEVTHKPDFENVWTCMECGEEAVTVTEPDTSPQTLPLKVRFPGGLQSFFDANLGPIPESYSVVPQKCRVHRHAYEKIQRQLERNLRCLANECDVIPSDEEIRECAEKLMKTSGPLAAGDVSEHHMVLDEGYLIKRKRYMGVFLKEEALMTKQEVLDYLRDDEPSTRSMDSFRTYLSDLLGIDVVWRHIVPGEEYQSAYIFPVQEGILWLPYHSVKDHAEIIDLDHAELLNADAVDALTDEFKAYSEDYLSVLNDIVSHYK